MRLSRTLNVLAVAVLAAVASGGCYVQTYPNPSTPSLPPAHSLTGRWRVEAVVPPGQPFAGTYTTSWAMQDPAGGRPTGSGVWSNGAQSSYTGWVNGSTVHLDRKDANGFHALFDGTLSADGNMMTGRCQNDPSSPGGNSASCTWTAWREAPPPPPAAMQAPPPPPLQAPPPQPATTTLNLTGRWSVAALCPGRYTTIWEVQDAGGQLTASGTWSNGARSSYTGWLRGGVLHLDRTDANGFRGAFDGRLSPDGASMTGGSKNDPTSPSGNAATCTWTAQRL